MTMKSIKLEAQTIEELKQNLEQLRKGNVALEQKTVKTAKYKALLPLDDIEIKHGETVYLYHLGKGIWLMIPEKALKQ